MRKVILALAALAVVVAPPSLAGQQPVSVLGRLLDAGTGAPIEGAVVDLGGQGGGVVTDAEGLFRLDDVLPGGHALRVRHLAYGTHTEDIEVPLDRDLAVELRLSAQALELEPIDVEVLRPARAATTRSNVITREQIAALQGRARDIADLVRTFIPGAAVSVARGGYVCLEFRGGRSSRTTGCNFPLIVQDGLPVTSPARFLRDLPVEDIERIEFVPASEGGVRYGLDATYGVLVIETRRSVVADLAPKVAPPSRYPAYEWAGETGTHPTRRSLFGASLGGLAGTALGLAAVGCFPGGASSGAACVEGAGGLAGVGASLLPLAGSVLGARALGATADSRGRLLPSLVVTALPALLGYAVYTEGVRSGFDGELWIGGTLVVVGTPLAATLADYLFRGRR